MRNRRANKPKIDIGGDNIEFSDNFVQDSDLEVSGRHAKLRRNVFFSSKNIKKLWDETWWGKILIGVVILLLGSALWSFLTDSSGDDSTDLTQGLEIASYEECVAAGYPIMESYPEQCAVPGGETYTRELDPNEKNAAESFSPYLLVSTEADIPAPFSIHEGTSDSFPTNAEVFDVNSGKKGDVPAVFPTVIFKEEFTGGCHVAFTAEGTKSSLYASDQMDNEKECRISFPRAELDKSISRWDVDFKFTDPSGRAYIGYSLLTGYTPF